MSGLSVLLVEDDPAMRAMIKATLEMAGHAVAEATDVSSALRHISQEDFDVVITDLLLGRSHGIVVLHEVKAQKKAPRVVVISGGSVLAAGALGADAALTKPFTCDELLAAVVGNPKR